MRRTDRRLTPVIGSLISDLDQIEPVLDACDAPIEIVEPTREADVILVQAEDIAAQVNNLALDPGEPGDDLILLFADLAELAEDPLSLAKDQLQGDLARVLGCILAHRFAVDFCMPNKALTTLERSER
jgi:hypothetical protein